jgi:hypothetical protein
MFALDQGRAGRLPLRAGGAAQVLGDLTLFQRSETHGVECGEAPCGFAAPPKPAAHLDGRLARSGRAPRAFFAALQLVIPASLNLRYMQNVAILFLT